MRQGWGRCGHFSLTLAIATVVALTFLGNLAAACLAPCTCLTLGSVVDCGGLHLLSLPPRLPDGVWLLELSHNNLSHLPVGSFQGLWGLRVLLLSHNILQNLASGALGGLSFLERLDLSHNQLARLPPDFSATLGSLLRLDLSHNLLATLDPCSLWGLGSLEQLDLSHNKLAELAAGLGGLYRLRWLSLAGNQLHRVEGTALATMTGLEVLSLAENNISELEAEAFASLRALGFLSLVGNQLQHLEFNAVARIQTAGTQLLLAINPWTCDCDLQRAFRKLSHLRHLRVADLGNLTCAGPGQLSGAVLSSVEARLCLAETATVLGITGTMLITVAVAVAVAVAERKRRQGPGGAGE
ncbi:leucine-rich repeat-containing protein 15-like [Cynocephalus volans]|uniref:leucine-rich repeat-containing protein 15-like n=1 Tax=Cynocephalus volans TaxID=110931 RepID=UPI002FCACC7B